VEVVGHRHPPKMARISFNLLEVIGLIRSKETHVPGPSLPLFEFETPLLHQLDSPELVPPDLDRLDRLEREVAQVQKGLCDFADQLRGR